MSFKVSATVEVYARPHAYEFRFRKPFLWLEARLAEPLQEELNEEVRRMADIIGGNK